MLVTRIYTLTLALGSLAVGACAADATDPDDAIGDEAQAVSGGEEPEPPPSPIEVIQQGGTFVVPPGVRVCFPELPANQSATIAGQYAYRNFVKAPKLIVYQRPNLSSNQTKFYTGSVMPDASGFYQKNFNSSSNPGLFPGRFQFCLRNNAANPGSFSSNAQVVTF